MGGIIIKLKIFFEEKSVAPAGIYLGALERKLTYQQIHQRAEQIADVIRSEKLPDQFLAAIILEHSVAYFEAFMAVVMAGGIPVPIHHFYGPDDVKRIFQSYEISCVITTSSKLSPDQMPEGNMRLYIDIETLACSRWQVSDTINRIPIPADSRLILLSSGSTGTPKGVILSADNVLSNMASIQHYVQLEPSDTVYMSKSLAYCSTITGEWLLALNAGANIFLAGDAINPYQMFNHLLRLNSVYFSTVPSVLIYLMKSAKIDLSLLTGLKKMTIVGSGMPPDLLMDLQRRIPAVEIMPSYGLTEAAPRVTYLPGKDVNNKPASVGKPIHNVHVKVMDNGELLPAGKVGEIVIQGPNVMLGYYNDNDRTTRTIDEHGLHSADLGFMDEDGYVYIIGRQDNAINFAGNLVYPENIEKFLLQIPNVIDAAIIGIPDDVWGNILFAMIKTSNPHAEFKEELLRLCQKELNKVERPRDFIFVDHIPKTRTGKIDRRKTLLLYEGVSTHEKYGAN